MLVGPWRPAVRRLKAWGDMTKNQPEISVCICTFRREALLRKLLDRLCRLDAATPRFEVVVVDNDAAASARVVIDEFQGVAPYALIYEVEPRQNISLARNRAIANARASWLALLDDDEYPKMNWLSFARETARRYDADMVMGPVLPEYTARTPTWAIRSGLFERERFTTGARVPWGQLRSGNVLMRRDCLRGHEGPFDPEYGLSGGEDTVLFDSLAWGGARIVWCDEAVVYEHLPAERLTARWLFMRHMRGGQTYANQHFKVHARGLFGALAHLVFIARTSAATLLCVVALLGTAPLGKHYRMRWWCKIAAQIGKMSSYTRWRFEPYRA